MNQSIKPSDNVDLIETGLNDIQKNVLAIHGVLDSLTNKIDYFTEEQKNKITYYILSLSIRSKNLMVNDHLKAAKEQAEKQIVDGLRYNNQLTKLLCQYTKHPQESSLKRLIKYLNPNLNIN